MTDYDSWARIIVGGVAVGAAFAGVLALSRSREPLMLLLGLLGSTVATSGIASLVRETSRAGAGIAGTVLVLAAGAGGYGLVSALLPMFARSPRPHAFAPELPPDTGLTDILLVMLVEPERYDAAAVAAELADLTEAGLAEPTLGITPFLFAAQKARYRAAGGTSPSLRTARSLTERIESSLSSHPGIGQVRLVTGIGRDTLAAAVAEASERGTRSIVAANVSVGESFEADRAKSEVDLMRPESAGMRIAYAPALWGAEAVSERIADRIWAARTEPSQTGVALIMHGQPESRERTHGAFDVQENAFCNRIRMLLAERGIPESNTRLCFLDWRDPDVTETIRHLAALGCQRILISPATLPFENVTTILDLKVAVRRARVPEDVSAVTLQAWGDDEVVASAICERVLEVMADLGSH